MILAPISCELLEPRERLPVWQWAERHVRLSRKMGTVSPGSYDSSWCMYVRGWMEAFQDPTLHDIAICTATQIGKTETLLNCLRYSIAEDPAPSLWVMPAENLARSFSESRLQPSIQLCEPTKALMPRLGDQFKLLEMHFRDCTVNLCGANSPGQLSSRPVRYLFADETDKWPEATDKEAGALELAQERTRSFWNRKRIYTSTPTTASGQIWQLYLNGDQRRYFVECPDCKHWQYLEFRQLKWYEKEKKGGSWDLNKVDETTEYQCVNCQSRWPQTAKPLLVRRGRWQSTAEAPKGQVSFHLSALYSPFRTWGSIATEFLQSKASITRLHNFTNSTLAEPWVVQGESIKEGRLRDMCGEYRRGSIPINNPIAIRITVDVQRESFYWIIAAFGPFPDIPMYVVDYGRCANWEDVALLTQYEITDTDGTTRTPDRGLIDAGFRTQEVYEFCVRSRGIWWPCKGGDIAKRNVLQNTYLEIFLKTGRRFGKRRARLALVQFNDAMLKTELYLRRIQDGIGPKIEFPIDTDDEFLKHLMADTLTERVNKRGISEPTWIQTSRENHWGDCVKMAVIHSLKVESTAPV